MKNVTQYEFANAKGKVILEEYKRGSGMMNTDILETIQGAFSKFPYNVEIKQLNRGEDVYCVHFEDNQMEDIYFCAKEVTPGGRKGLMDEQRIQIKAKYLNYVYDKTLDGHQKGILMGVYKKDGVTVLCTWKVTKSDSASEDTGVSKQIKITSIAKAIREGFAQYKSKRGNTYACVFRPEFLFFYLTNSSWIHNSPLTDLNEHNTDENSDSDLLFNTDYTSVFAPNRILFGAPGTGKSFTLNKECKELLGVENEDDYERVTFHPDYSYANFVGTYKPVPAIDENGKEVITYKYVPGPFMRLFVEALKNAQTNSPRPFLLIIEEINRANVAAVFGDVFQLLDRDDDGVSEYPIQASEDIKKYLSEELGGDPNDYKKIRIPNNMFIWATMNSADQGVFPMDTAFKRRWDFTYLGINENDEGVQGKYVSLAKGTQKIEWNELRKAINDFLADKKINEDKQLGPYFIARKIVVPKDGGNEINSDEFIRVFKNKVIMYLFEDAAKQKHTKLFEGCTNNSRYSDICREFDKKGIDIFSSDITNKVNKVIDEVSGKTKEEPSSDSEN